MYTIHQEQGEIETEAREHAQMLLTFGQSCRRYTNTVLSPAVQKDRPGFLREADSGTFVTRGIFAEFNREIPGWTLREVAINPLNPYNQADDVNAALIRRFQSETGLNEIAGFRQTEGAEQFYLARPMIVEHACLACHGNPRTAPREVVERYGTEHGYGWKEGEVQGAVIVSLPTTVMRAAQRVRLWRHLGILGGLTVILVFLNGLLFQLLVNRRLAHAVAVMEEMSGNPTGHLRIREGAIDEIGHVERAFNRMADSVSAAYDRLESEVTLRTRELATTNQSLQEELAERRRAEKSLRESEERFRLIAETIQDVFWIATPNIDRIHYVSPAYATLWGRSVESLYASPRSFMDAVHPDDREGLLAELAKCADGSFCNEYRLIQPDGSIRWIRDRGFPVDDEAGAIRSMVGIATDITDVKRAEASLRESEERFRSAFDYAAAGMAIVGLDGTWVRVNRALCEIVGYTEEELQRVNFQAITHPDDLDGDLVQLGKLLAGEILYYHLEKRYLAKNRSVIWVLLSVALIRDERGAPVYFLAQIQDITQRRKAEEESRRTRVQLLDAIESLAAGFVMFGPDERLVICNSKYKEFYALCASAMVPGTPYEEILRLFCRNGAHLHTGLSEDEWVSARLQAHRNPGQPSEQHLADRWMRISDQRTSDGGIVSLRTDVTALKQAQEAAEAASQAKSDFLATMSHEIRTPLNGIIGPLDLLTDSALTEQQRNIVGIASASAASLLGVVNDILDFSKIEAGKMELEVEPFDLRELVEAAVDMLTHRADEKGIDLLVRYAPHVPSAVLGDSGRVRQVLLNLLSNALKFTARGHVLVEVTADAITSGAAEMRIAVQDSGIGIPEEKLQSVFEQFSQADMSTTRKYGGTGLGLTICKRLIELMGGRIAAHGRPGGGTTFQVDLPLQIDATAVCQSIPLPKLRVLVLADSPLVRALVRDDLDGLGVGGAACASAAEAMVMLGEARSAGQPYAVVVAVCSPWSNEACLLAEAVRADADLCATRLMRLASLAQQRGDAALKNVGYDLTVCRPAHRSKLAAGLASLCGLKSATNRGAATDGLPTTVDHPGARVLVVEDNPVNQRVATLLLQSLGCTAEIAGTGRDALALLERESYDLILMDCQMPEMDGFETTQCIRQRGHGTVPIIALTARTLKGDRERCLDAGMNDYLSKPLQKELLADRLNRWLLPNGKENMSEFATTDVTVATALTPQPVSDSPLDPEAVERWRELARETDSSLLTELFELFQTDGIQGLATMREAAGVGDLIKLGKAAHGLKGAAASVGAPRVRRICQQLEGRERTLDAVEVALLLAELESELILVQANMKTHLLAEVKL